MNTYKDHKTAVRIKYNNAVSAQEIPVAMMTRVKTGLLLLLLLLTVTVQKKFNRSKTVAGTQVWPLHSSRQEEMKDLNYSHGSEIRQK